MCAYIYTESDVCRFEAHRIDLYCLSMQIKSSTYTAKDAIETDNLHNI